MTADFLTRFGPISEVQFDELETSEHTKCKPVSVPLAVHAVHRLILAYDVCSMPAKGPLARIALKKYGKRADHRRETIGRLLREIKPMLKPAAVIRSDSNPLYPELVCRNLPGTTHALEISRAACVAGQGELKKIGQDPLFSINHTCAMLRANVCRLIRRTWCTTKRIDRLRCHLAIYAVSHNRKIMAELIKKLA